MTYGEIFRDGTDKLKRAGIEEAALDARLLLEYVCGTDRSYLLAHEEEPVPEEKHRAYEAMIKRRAERIPLQQLTGVQYFMGLEFLVNEHVLIPRQDTEILVEEALKHLHDGMRVLDLCTGSGCILISLLRYTNGCRGMGVDISKEALSIAGRNAEKLLGVAGCPDVDAEKLPDATDCSASDEGTAQVQFLESDLFEKVEGSFDMIVSNPPYIPSSTVETLMPEVRDHEPRLALDGSADGLAFYRRITAECERYLEKGGMLFFEIGCDQGSAVSSLMEQAGFLDVQVIKDYAGLDRVVCGTLSLGM